MKSPAKTAITNVRMELAERRSRGSRDTLVSLFSEFDSGGEYGFKSFNGKQIQAFSRVNEL